MKSLVAVVAGVVVWGVLWVGANAAAAAVAPASFDEVGATTSPFLLVFFVGVCVALSVLAGWICARLAPRLRMRHVAVLAAVQLAIGIMVQTGVWDLMPLWYHLTFLGVVVPSHLLGGRLAVGGVPAGA